MPPSKNEEIDSVIQALQAKADYYKDANPNSIPHAEFAESKPYRKKEDDRQTKKLTLNGSDFPSL